MELSEIRKECRELLDDIVEPYGISDEALIRRINQAEKEACTRSDLLIDSTKTKFCKISVLTGINNYKVNPLVVDVLRGELPSAHRTLDKLGYKALDEDERDWMNRTGTPTGYALDLETNKLYLSHVPIIDETLSMTVSRLPKYDMENDNDTPEVNGKYHYDLIYWALSLCYSDHDFDSYDQDAADRYEAKFISRFGERPNAKQLEGRLRKYRRRAKAHFM